MSRSTLVPTSSTAPSTPSGTRARTASETSPSSISDLVDTQLVIPGCRRGAPGGGQDGDSLLLGQDRDGHTDRGRATANQQCLAWFDLHADSERPGGGLQHFRDCTEDIPGEVAGERYDLGGGDTGVLGVPAVELTTPASISAATWAPTGNSPPGAAATTPTALIPGIRGKDPKEPRPRRKCCSDRFSPKARTATSTQPG